MKAKLIILAVISCIFFASCNKCAVCTHVISYRMVETKKITEEVIIDTTVISDEGYDSDICGSDDIKNEEKQKIELNDDSLDLGNSIYVVYKITDCQYVTK